jgi:hypothetical protein
MLAGRNRGLEAIVKRTRWLRIERIPLPLVLLPLVSASVTAAQSAVAEEVAVGGVWLQEIVDGMRQAEGLPGLREDAWQDYSMQKRLGELLAEQRTEVLDPGRVMEVVAWTYHWHRREFVASGESPSDLLADLGHQPAFNDAVLWPEATHFAFGCAQDTQGRLWCVGCAMREMIEELMHGGDWEFRPGGGGARSHFITGRTQYPFVRIRFYKGDGDPTDCWGPGHRVDVRPDQTGGAFEVALPTSDLEGGDYQVILCVSGYGDPDYTIAAQTVFRVEK